MRRAGLIWIMALSIGVTAATLIGRATAELPQEGCCVCLCGMSNATMMPMTSGFGGQTVCTPSDDLDACGLLCDELSCIAKFAEAPCSAPELAEVCGVASMAPASSPTGLVALAAILSGLGAFYLRRRSLRS